MPPDLPPNPSPSGDSVELLVAFDRAELRAHLVGAFNAGASTGLHPDGRAVALLDLICRGYVDSALAEVFAAPTCPSHRSTGGDLR